MMVRRRGVSLTVDEGFFKRFETARKIEQFKLRKQFGQAFNLPQRKFTGILAKKNFRFQFPKQKPPANKGGRK